MVIIVFTMPPWDILEKNLLGMDLYESTLLAGVPNAPSIYAPTNNFELCKERQKQVADAMLKYEYLSEEDYKALMEQIDSKISFY